MLFVNHVDGCIVYQRFRPEEEFAVPVGDARVVGEGQFQFDCSHFLKNLNCCFYKVCCCFVIRCVLITLQNYNDVLYLANFSAIIFQKYCYFYIFCFIFLLILSLIVDYR